MFESMQYKVALFIDGDNASGAHFPQIFAEASKIGTITVRRIFGDWTTSNMNKWKDVLSTYAVQPIQQFRHTVGKNATDSAMIIDAMDVLHSGQMDCFCIVSSDSDYTRLCTRIRESGIAVIGIGEQKTPKAFIHACDQFIFTENLARDEEERQKKRTTASKPAKLDKHTTLPTHLGENRDLESLAREAYDMASRDDEWALLSLFGIMLRQLDPSFDPRSYGYHKLRHLVGNLPYIDLKSTEQNGQRIWYVCTTD